MLSTITSSGYALTFDEAKGCFGPIAFCVFGDFMDGPLPWWTHLGYAQPNMTRPPNGVSSIGAKILIS